MAIRGGGGGAAVGNIIAGGAVFEFVAKDHVGPAADKLKQKLSGFGQWAKGMGQGLSGSLLFGGAASAGVAFSQKVLGKTMENVTKGAEEALFATTSLAEAAKRGAEHYARIATSADRIASSALEGAGRIADPRNAFAFLTAERQRLLREDQGLARAEAAHERGTRNRSALGDVGEVFGFGDDRRAAARAQMEAVTAARAGVQANLAALDKEMAKLARPEAMESFRAPLESLSQRINDTLDPVIQGMGEFERAAYELSRDKRLSGLAREIEELRKRAIAADAQLRGPGGSGLAALLFGQFEALGPILAETAKFNELKAAMDTTKGGFNTRAGNMQFGLGDDVMKKQLNLLDSIAQNTAKTEKAVSSMRDLYKMEP